MTTPIKIRTLADLAATDEDREDLATRCVNAFAQAYEKTIGLPTKHDQSLTGPQVVTLVSEVLARVLLDEPASGVAVDVASDHFRAAFHRVAWGEFL